MSTRVKHTLDKTWSTPIKVLSIRSIPLFIFQSRTEGTHPFSIRNLPVCSNSLQALLCRLLAGKQLKNIIESIHERRTVIV